MLLKNLLRLWSPRTSVSWSSSDIILLMESRKSLISRLRHSLFSLHLSSNNAQWWASHNASMFTSSWTGESFIYLHDTTFIEFNHNIPGHARGVFYFCKMGLKGGFVLWKWQDVQSVCTVHPPTYCMATCQINKCDKAVWNIDLKLDLFFHVRR